LEESPIFRSSASGKTTETGDRAEIKTLLKIARSGQNGRAGELCSGQKCPQFERFHTKMHQKATESDLIIVNHHPFSPISQ
jgi:hypothetical protein